MANKHAQDLRRRIVAASENLCRQILVMDTHMERADAPGEWTTREVLSHLLFKPGFAAASLPRPTACRIFSSWPAWSFQ